jgi:hypothetical protein
MVQNNLTKRGRIINFKEPFVIAHKTGISLEKQIDAFQAFTAKSSLIFFGGYFTHHHNIIHNSCDIV